ncbi:hypothetical protein GCM10022243_67030 [Saccharothrix violaceirubra]|uniref:Uncharacterized protein n=1 Tax=Saccharothrix violaceirubra TaxID=413306 RepID=A0A7W7WVW4_9PSEU|nr:hypothetical protein [Saccharothrix violaceirubra]MBB4965506.1 hypothetical protein [Saccharothrix violaceirubra]
MAERGVDLAGGTVTVVEGVPQRGQLPAGVRDLLSRVGVVVGVQQVALRVAADLGANVAASSPSAPRRWTSCQVSAHTVVGPGSWSDSPRSRTA